MRQLASERQPTLLAVDGRRLLELNDEHGHAMDDAVLSEVSSAEEA